jgi:3D (Asp-Asp-Asp) domain-containing protein
MSGAEKARVTGAPQVSQSPDRWAVTVIRQDTNPIPSHHRHGVSALRVGALLGVCGLVSLSAVVTKEAVARSSRLEPLAALAPAPAKPSILETARPLLTEAGSAVTDPLTGPALAGPPAPTPDDLAAREAEEARAAAVITEAAPAPALEPASPAYADAEVRYFNGRPCRPARTMTMVVTAYSPDWRSCGDSADGITSSLHDVGTNAMKLVAADTRLLPLGSMISVPGYDDGKVVPVLDRGGAIKGHRLDVLYPTHEAARRWGVRTLKVTVWEYADGKPADDFRAIRDSRN